MPSLLRFEAFERLPGIVAHSIHSDQASMQHQRHIMRRALMCLGNISKRS